MAIARTRLGRVGGAVLGAVPGARRAPRSTAYRDSAEWGAATFNSFDRAQYFGLGWHFYRNTAYIDDPASDPFAVISRYLALTNAYPKLRGIYNPVTRLVNAIVAVTVGGPLDPDAGNGTIRRSALPIITKNEDLRPAIARFWQDSAWDRKKSLAVRLGAATGAVGLRLMDDPERERVGMAVVPPWEVEAVELDHFDNVIFWRQSYWYDEETIDEKAGKVVATRKAHRFTLEIDKDEFRTYRDNQPWGYEENNYRDFWPNPYGFVPAVWIKHIDAGPETDVGLCAYHNSIPLINELNTIASHLAEQIKKSVHPQFFLSGATEPKSSRFIAGLRVWWNPNPDAKAQILNDKLDIQGVVEAMKDLTAEIEKNHPLLNFYIVRNRVGGSGDLSGKAVHTMLYDIEADAEEAQAPYYAGQVRAQKMAISIGGWRGYPGYEAFEQQDIDAAYGEGDLNHYIGHKPLIRVDEEQELALAQKTAEVVGLYIKAEKESGLTSDELIQRLQAAQAQVQSGFIEGGETEEISFVSEEQRKMLDEQAKLAVDVQKKALEAPVVPPGAPKPAGTTGVNKRPPASGARQPAAGARNA